MMEFLVFLSFLSVSTVCFLLGWLQWKCDRCTSNRGVHNWKRISENYHGHKHIPDAITIHLKCENCGKEMKKTYNI